MITYTVTTLADESDPGATVPSPGGTGLSLREAIALANASAGLDTIVFAAGLTGGTIRLTNAAGTLTVTDALQIVGDAGDNGSPDITISGDVLNNDIKSPGGGRGSNIQDNVAHIFSATDDLVIDGLVLTNGGNISTQSGGAIESNDYVALVDSVVAASYAEVAGGGIRVNGGQTAFFSNVTFIGNASFTLGGGLSVESATLSNVTFYDNSSEHGGAISGTDISVINGTFVHNGGGPQITATTLNLANSIVMAGTAGVPEIVATAALNRIGGNIIGTDVFSGNTDVGNTTLSDVFRDIATFPSGSPKAILADNGGVPTVALRAAATNPALDASSGPAPVTDARGFARFDQGGIPNSNGTSADLGAYEVTTEVASLVVTTLADVVNELDNLTSLREAVAYANSHPGLDTITFAAGLSGGTIRLTNAAGTLMVTDALRIVGDAGDNGSPDITISGDKNANDVTFAGGITNVFASNLADNIQLFQSTADMAVDGLILTGGVTATSGSASAVSGGAIRSTATVNVTDSVISGNQAVVGGGIAAQAIVLSNSTVSFNDALLDGGGLYTTSLTLLNATLSGNHASSFGGGAFVMSATVVNATITGNDGAFQGGGIYGYSIDITNSIAIGNESQSNPNSLQAFTITRHGGNIIGSNNLGGVDHINVYSGDIDVGDTTAAEVFAALSVSPIGGVLSGTLADNGGGKPTIALKASLNNPVLDASDSAAPETDETNMARVNQPIPNANGGTADLGAKELALFLPVITGTAGDDSYDQPATETRIDAGGGIDTITFHFKLTEAKLFYFNNTVVISGPDGSHSQLSGFEIYKFTDGTVNNNDGDPLVDDLYYYTTNHDVWNAHADADAHFHQHGWHEGRNPDIFFSTQFYFAVYPEVRGTDPLMHFDQTGWKTGRLPSLNFDPAAYLAAYPDVKAAGVDPLAHFLQFGAGEGRQSVVPTELIAPNGFDYVYYLKHNADVAAAGVDPFQHFQQFGWKEGRNPNALFDVNGYLNTYTDVKAAGINPLDHYNSFGWHEGRDPSPGFDTTSYLAAYADVKAAGVNPLVHFLDFGIHEGRSPFADGVWG